jgi:hypothetical protein
MLVRYTGSPHSWSSAKGKRKMLGKIIVRDDIVYLIDDPIIDPSSIERHFVTLGETLRTTGLRNLLVQGATQAVAVDEDLIANLITALVAVIPPDTRIAFAHASVPSIEELSDHACRCLEAAGVTAISTATQADAASWLRRVAAE